MVAPTKLEVLCTFGMKLLENPRLVKEIKNLQVHAKLNYILKNYCENFGSTATYENIIRVLLELNLNLLSDEVEFEAKRRQPVLCGSGTKIEYKDIVDIRKILLKNLDFVSQLNTFASLLSIEQADGTPKSNINRILSKFWERYPERARFEYLMDILQDKMDFKNLAVSQNPKSQFFGDSDGSCDFYDSDNNEIVHENLDFRPKVVRIPNGATGHSYETLFGEYLTKATAIIVLEDPYFEEPHQATNLDTFVELLFVGCPLLKNIIVVSKHFNQLTVNKLEKKCADKNIGLNWKMNPNLHDRCLRILYLKSVEIQMGRCLDMFKRGKKSNSVDQTNSKCKEVSFSVVPVEPNISKYFMTSSSEEEGASPPKPTKNKSKKQKANKLTLAVKRASNIPRNNLQ